ncbi:MAG: UDP-3-O-(3-hydroxymyristoyl)glucosamine N-acyltransferase [Elusimicrobiota bacterium]
MKFTAREIANITGGIVADKDGIADKVVITAVADITSAGEGQLAFCVDTVKYNSVLQSTKAAAVLVPEDVKDGSKSTLFIIVKKPYQAFVKVLNIIDTEKKKDVIPPTGIAAGAIVHPSAKFGINVSIGTGTVVEHDVVIGDNVKILPLCYIGPNVVIGNDCLLYARVTICNDTVIGERVVINPGAVLGGDGYGFIPTKDTPIKIPQVGCVKVGNDVEIGANCAIDRATLGATVIGDGTKIDNLVHIAHNVAIGKNCLITAQVCIAGSTVLGDRVVIGGQAGIVDHVNVGDDVNIVGQTGVVQDVPSGSVMSGFPARQHKDALKIYTITAKLPEIYEVVKKFIKKND